MGQDLSGMPCKPPRIPMPCRPATGVHRTMYKHISTHHTPASEIEGESIRMEGHVLPSRERGNGRAHRCNCVTLRQVYHHLCLTFVPITACLFPGANTAHSP
jgi:hypothetical protein